MIVRELLIRLGVQVTPAIDKVPSRIQPIIDKSNEAGAAFRNMLGAFAGLSALKMITNVADQMQSLQFRIGELPQTVVTAAQAFDTVAAHAIDARQNVAQYAQLYVRVGSATKNFLSSQEEVLQVTDAISKALVIGGASALEQKSAIEQLSQGFQAGKFQGNDFKIAMAALSTDIREKLATAMGYTLENLKEMSSKGKITAEMLAKAFIKIGPDVAYSFRKVPMTIGQAFTIIQGKFSVFINRMNRESSAITTVATFFVNTFSSIEKSVNGLVDTLEGGGQALKIFALLIAAALTPAAIKLFVGAISTIFSPATLLIALLFIVALALEDVYTWFKDGDSIIGRWIGKVSETNDPLINLKKALVGISGVLVLLAILFPAVAARAALLLIANTFGVLGGAIIGLLKNIPTLIGFVQLFFTTLIPPIWAAVTAFFALNVAVFGVTLPLWAIIGIIALIAGAVYVLYKVFTGQFGDIRDFVSGVWDGILSGFRSMVDGMMSVWQKFKSFWGIDSSTSFDINGNGAPGTPQSPSTMQYPTSASNSNSTIVTINQTLPPGSAPEVATAAYEATDKAMNDFSLDSLNRRMSQYGAS